MRSVWYFAWRWPEPPVDHLEWGASTWYFEVDRDDLVVGQWEVYDNGVVLRYDDHHLMDEHGFLADQPFDADEAAEDGAKELDAGATRPRRRR